MSETKHFLIKLSLLLKTDMAQKGPESTNGFTDVLRKLVTMVLILQSGYLSGLCRH